jgi:hypothetical protein
MTSIKQIHNERELETDLKFMEDLPNFSPPAKIQQVTWRLF